jgi:uncharacterized protein YecT (DUF1311 family)
MSDQGKSPSSNTQIWLAIIGLIGALGGAVIANWDKFVPQTTVPSTSHPPTTAVAPATLVSAGITNSGQAPEPLKEVQSPQQSMPAVGPSFDCAKATYRSERLICSSSDLAVLDLALDNAYRNAATRVRTREHKVALRNLQNDWLRNVREACVDVECLRGAYEDRLRELNAIQP